MTRIGRNDPCWCGSGKKYKHCHLRVEQAQQGDLVQQERAFQSLYAKLVELSGVVRGEGDFEAAYDLYWNGRMDVAAPGKLKEDRFAEFLEFYVFDFQTAQDGKTILDLVSERRRGELNAVEQRLLDQWGASYRGLYQIVSLGRDSTTLRDLLQGDEVTTNDSLSSEVKPGLAVAARILPAGERKHLARGITVVPPELVDPMVVYMQRQFQLYQERRIGGKWPEFLHERGYLFNYFLLEQIPPEPIATPGGNGEAQTVQEVLHELQSAIIIGPLEQHYARWIDKPVKAWGNRSPRQMMATDHGRERVAAVLDALEEAEETKRAVGQPWYEVDRLRAMLGFEKPMPTGGGRLVV